MPLQLTKPLIFFDVETTGVSITKDRILELSYIKLFPDGHEESHTYRFNPEQPIPAESTEVHHITDADVADKPTFKQTAEELKRIFDGCDFAGFNSNRFDLPILGEEFCRAEVDFDTTEARLIDVQTIYHKMEPRTLVAAYRFYCDKDLIGAHSALADTRATLEVLLAQVEKYDNIGKDIETLSKFGSQARNVDFMGRLIYNAEGKEVINFGQYKGKTAEEVYSQDPNYFDWVDKGDFPLNTKKAFKAVKEKIKAQKKQK